MINNDTSHFKLLFCIKYNRTFINAQKLYKD